MLRYCEERRSSLSSSWLVINLPPLPTSLRLTLEVCCVMIMMRGSMMMVVVVVMMMILVVMMVNMAGH